MNGQRMKQAAPTISGQEKWGHRYFIPGYVRHIPLVRGVRLIGVFHGSGHPNIDDVTVSGDPNIDDVTDTE